MHSHGVRLSMRHRRFGDRFERVACHFFVAGIYGQIAERENADQAFVAVQNREAADLVLFHHVGRVTDVLVFKTVDNLRRHDIADFGRAGVESRGHGSHGDVAIRDDSGKAIITAADW